MSERLDVDRQRLKLTRAFGEEFVSALEGGLTEKPLVNRLRSRLRKRSGLQVIGSEIDENTELPDIVGRLNEQMGLPGDSDLKDIRARLAGQEERFVLVLSGFKRLPPGKGEKILKKVKYLGVDVLYDPKEG